MWLVTLFSLGLTAVVALVSPVSYSGVNVNSMTIQSSRNTCIQVSVVQHSETLIVMYKKGPYSTKNIVAIKECVVMLRNGACDLLIVLLLFDCALD